MEKLLFSVWALVLLIVMGILVLNRIFVGKVHKYQHKISSPNRFLIKKENQIDIQKGPECGAFSTSFVLRHFDKKVYGEELYKQIPYKMRDGGITPKGIRSMLHQNGFEVICYRGTLEELKNEVSKGNPVIILTRVRMDKRWMHYVPIVGYDEHCMFIAESLQELVNCKETYYNRKVSNSEFERLWDIRSVLTPVCRNLFFVVSRK